MLGLCALSTAAAAAAQGVVDVAIVGGGMTGACLAAALGEASPGEASDSSATCSLLHQRPQRMRNAPAAPAAHEKCTCGACSAAEPPCRCPPRPAASNPLTNHLRVALLDRQPPTRMPPVAELPPHADIRVSTLTPASVALLRSVGAWRALAPATAPFVDMQASRSSPVIDLTPQIVSFAAPGQHLDSNRASAALPMPVAAGVGQRRRGLCSI